MSLRFRLNLLITLILLLFMLAVGFVVIKGMKSTTQEGVESATRVTIQLLDTVILSSYQNPEWGYTHEVMHRFLQSLGHVRSNEITLSDLHGNLIYRSPSSKYREEETPPQWFIHLLAPEQEVVIRRIRFGLLEVASNPGGAIREAWSRFTSLLWIGAGFFLVLNIAVYWMLGRWLRPIQPMLEAISKVEQGDLTTRLPDFKLPEFSRMARNFNLMGESLQASTEESRRLALIVKQTADAIMIHDLNGNISFWNPAAQRMFGYGPEDIIGKSAALLIPQGAEDELAQNLAVIAGKRPVEQYDTQRVARDGKLKDVSLSAAPLIDPHTDEVIGEICSMRDITERKQAEETAQQLEENRQLTYLIQRHIEDERRSLARELHDELSQYVTAIKTFAVGIANKTKTQMPDIEANAQTIVAAANHIYDGMHNIVRQLRPGALDNLGLSETLRDSVNSWQAQNPKIKFTLQLSENFDTLGETLNINLYRIVQEAVTNAIRHAEASEIDIALSRVEDTVLQLTIKDNGLGMNICNVDQTQHFGLLGMRERTQALQGSFTVDSMLQQGTLIKVLVPEIINSLK
ncbi:histidine kinase [Methylovorus sp. MM2]|uniref:PAS domain S-box protein n=1 Tax=Methylovorus sp. MM2 TaxID=1848038 RepID=UPI0007E1BF0E|nr:PAS domain S-box protein [Methylovorus sp. MM2]OAM52822.1 histidine kinase [Methylovorus sp. MM2]